MHINKREECFQRQTTSSGQEENGSDFITFIIIIVHSDP